MDCKNCGNDLEQYANWDYAGKTIKCDKCNTMQVVQYDETFDGEEEFGWFYTDYE